MTVLGSPQRPDIDFVLHAFGVDLVPWLDDANHPQHRLAWAIVDVASLMRPLHAAPDAPTPAPADRAALDAARHAVLHEAVTGMLDRLHADRDASP